MVVARAPRPGHCKRRLEPLLGPEGCARLQAALIARALRWAADVGDPYLAFSPEDAHDEVAPLATPGTRLVGLPDGDLGARLAAATARVLAEHAGPVLLAGADTPQMRPEVGRHALEDLEDGIDVTFAPANHGGYYLVALREPRPEIFDLPAGTWDGEDVFPRTLEVAHAAGLSLGMLRAERGLHDEGDVRALLADPLAPADIVSVLRAAGAT